MEAGGGASPAGEREEGPEGSEAALSVRLVSFALVENLLFAYGCVVDVRADYGG